MSSMLDEATVQTLEGSRRGQDPHRGAVSRVAALEPRRRADRAVDQVDGTQPRGIGKSRSG